MDIKHNIVYNIDCLELMKELPNNYFDLLITDVPYGILNSQGWIKTSNYDDSFKEWDCSIPSKEHFKELLRTSKNQIIFGGNYCIEHLYNSNCWVVWDKLTGKNDFADAELAWTSFSSAVRIFRYKWAGASKGNGDNQSINPIIKEIRWHPTQKPVKLGEWLLDNYAKKGDLIFDAFAGSGSFLVACKNKGFYFIGCEKEKNYCDIINKRLSQNTII